MIELFIDGQPCPVECGSSIALNYDVAALADVQSGRQAEVVELTVPVTTATAPLFGNGDDPLTAERFNAAVHRAEVRVEGVVLFCGTARLAEALLRGAEARYRIEIKGDTALWARSAALRKIAAASVKFNGDLLPADICEGWSGTSPVKFFPVNRTTVEMASSSVSLLPAERVMTTDDYWPFISVEAMVRAIFADAGYTIESRFMQGQLFRSLYMSGGYAQGNTSEHKARMNFLAGRTGDASATADYYGRVNMSATLKLNSVGNIVDTAQGYITDSSGNRTATGFFANSDCFRIDEKSGVACFVPTGTVNVGFEYSIAFITDHVIASRTALKGFNRLYLGDDLYVPFTLVNNHTDQRESPMAGYAYKLMIFDYREGCTYRLKATVDGVTKTVADTTSRMTAVTLPDGREVTYLTLLRAEKGSTVFNSHNDDWALYWGYVEERGRTEVELKVRTPAERLTPAAGKRFDKIFIEGAEAGMTFTLLKRTTLRPVFAGAAGYGSHLTFADVAAIDIRQSDLLAALGHMFNLQFCTDEPAKKVFIEPFDDFFDGRITDWSDRIDLGDTIVVSDPAFGMHETTTFGYGEDDAAVTRFNNANGSRLGRWSFTPDTQAALDGEQLRLNPLFSPTVSECDKYFEARSAQIMQVRDTEEASDDTLSGNFSPRIVRYAGLAPLAAGEVWNSPFSRPEYPLAAFHFAGDERNGGFTLCFEDRDRQQGLNRFHRRHLTEEGEGRVVTLSLHLHPHEVAALMQCRADAPSARSRFRLDIAGRSSGALYTLRTIKSYDPERATARCSFTKIRETA